MTSALTYQFIHFPTLPFTYPLTYLLLYLLSRVGGVCIMDQALLATGDQGPCLSWELKLLR